MTPKTRRISYNTPNPWVAVGNYLKAREQCNDCDNFKLPEDIAIKNPIRECCKGIRRPEIPCLERTVFDDRKVDAGDEK